MYKIWQLKYPSILLMIFLTTSCGENENSLVRESEGIPIQIRATIGDNPTRIDIEQDSLIFNGERVYVWGDITESGQPYYMLQSWNVISDGAGHLNSADGSTRYYPPGNTMINLLALHGRFDTPTTEGSPKPTETTHTVYTDQSIPANYYGSDLLYAKVDSQDAKKHICLLFNHVLCRIEVCLQPWGDITDADLIDAKVYIKDINIKTKLNINTGYAKTYGDSSDVQIALATIPAAAIDFNGATYGAAIIPPQTVKGVFFQVELLNGTKFYYVPEWPIRLEAGKRYRFNMNLKHLMVLRPDDLEPWQFGADVDKTFEEPMTIIPYVTDWNSLSFTKGWHWMVVTPELIPDWEFEENEKGWWWMVAPPGVSAWDDTPSADKHFGGEYELFTNPNLTDWDTTQGEDFLFDANNKNGNTFPGTKIP